MLIKFQDNGGLVSHLQSESESWINIFSGTQESDFPYVNVVPFYTGNHHLG